MVALTKGRYPLVSQAKWETHWSLKQACQLLVSVFKKCNESGSLKSKAVWAKKKEEIPCEGLVAEYHVVAAIKKYFLVGPVQIT